MKNSKLSILLLAMVMILAISAVSAADTNDTSDSVAQAVDEAPVEEVASNVDALAATDNTDVLSAGEQNFTQLQTAVDSGTVSMSNDYVRQAGENTISINRDVTIVGNDYKIDGNNLGGIFNVNSGYTLTLTGVTLINGNSENGAAVYVNDGAVLIANAVNFIDNVAADNGGAIYTEGGQITLTNCVLDSNDVTNLESSAFENKGGAAIYAKDAQVTLVNTDVTNNGRRELDRSNGDMINAVLNLLDSNTVITGGLFENNTGIYGGAIIAEGDGSQTLTVSGATFKNNKAYNGGAIDISSMITDISDCTFDNNWVVGPGSTGYYGLGGAVATDGSGSFSLTGSNFTGNKATGLNASAGAVSVGLGQGCPATIDGCVFKENTAELKGGAVFIAGYDDDATISNCNFSDDNTAEIGGSLYNGGNLKLTNNVIEGDSGIYSSGAGKIDTHVWVIVNDNQDVTVEYYDTIPIVVKITDDNGNLIRIDEPTLTIDLGDQWTRQTLTLDEATGFYTMDNYLVDQKSGKLTPSRTTIQKYFSSYNANTNLNSSYITMIKATPTVEVVYENVTDLDDVVINITVTGKEGAPKISWAATAATPFKIFVNNETYKVKISNGVGSVTIPNLPAGEYVINASWDGNTRYNGIEPQLYNLLVTPLKGTYTDLQAQIDAADGVLDLAYNFTYNADIDGANFINGVLIDKAITVNGNGYTISGSDAARIFNVIGGSLTLNNVSLINASADNGAAVYVGTGASLNIANSTLSSNVASDNGGAIYTEGGQITLTNCVLDSNDVTNLESSAFENKGGAAIYAKDAQVFLVNTNVTNNGRSELDRSKGNMINAVVNLLNSDVYISGSLFENNTGIYGGAIVANGDGNKHLIVYNSTFNNNKAYNGAAIDISSMKTTIQNCEFNDNWVVGPGSSGYYGLGGAVATDGSGSFSLTDSNFTGNKATGLNASAGAVSVGLGQGCPATIDGCVFKENTAELKGGAVFIAGYDDDATVSNCNFSDDNTAEIGSSLYNGGNLKLTNNVIEGDSGIYSSGAGKIDTHVWVIVNDNQNVTVEYYDTIPIVLKITDDNGNLIRIDEPTIDIDLGDRWTRYALTLDESTGFYTMDNYLVDQKSGLLTPSRTTIGKYFASYNANTNLNSSYVTMIKANASMEVTYQNVSRPDDVVITINLTGKQGAPKISWAATAATPFKVTVNDVEYKVKITNGIGTLTIPDLPAGEYVVNASWDGNTKYNPIEPTTFILKVSNLNVTKFTVETIGKYLSDDNVTLFVTLLGLNDEGLNETFNVIVNNAEYAVTVTNGTGTLNISGLAPGHYSALGIFPGNNNYNRAYATGLFTVSDTPSLDFNISFPENSTDSVFSISMPQDAGGYLLVDIDGQHYYAPVKNGTATIVVPGLAPGNYTATVSYTGDDKYVNASTTKEVSVPSNLPENALTVPETADTDSPVTYAVNLPADAGGYLEVDVDGTRYIAPLNNGSASITVPALSEGEHNVTVKYSGDGKYSSASKDTKLSVHVPVYNIAENKDVSVIYSANAYYKVLVTKDGKAVGAGESVTIKYNGKTYTVKTDSKGYATLKLNTKVKVKTYTITAEYKGVKVTNKVTIKHVIKAKNKKVKKSKKVTKVKITLKKVNGKVLKSKKITIKFKGKKYKVKTNKKGVATWKLKKSVVRKLTVGKKYKYRMTYGKDVLTKKLTVKR